MKIAISAVIVTLMTLSSEVLACSCAPERHRPGVTMDQIRKEKREYFLNKFQGAAFIGKIVKREIVIVNWTAKTEAGEPADAPMYRYTIRVKEYWLGVKSPTVIVYGESAEPVVLRTGESYGWSSCGFKLNTDQTFFFTPELYQNSLQISQCDFAGGGSDPADYLATEFRKIMGVPKRF